MKINDYQNLIERTNASSNQLRTSVRGKNLAVSNAIKAAKTRPPMPPIERGSGGGSGQPPEGTPEYLNFIFDIDLPQDQIDSLMDRVLTEFASFLMDSATGIENINTSMMDPYVVWGGANVGWEIVATYPPGTGGVVVLRYSPNVQTFVPYVRTTPGGFEVLGFEDPMNNITRRFKDWLNNNNASIATLLSNRLLPILYPDGIPTDPDVMPLPPSQEQITTAFDVLKEQGLLPTWLETCYNNLPDGWSWQVYPGESMTNPGASPLPSLGFRLVDPGGNVGVSIGWSATGYYDVIGGTLLSPQDAIQLVFGVSATSEYLFDLFGGAPAKFGISPGTSTGGVDAPDVDGRPGWLSKIIKAIIG